MKVLKHSKINAPTKNLQPCLAELNLNLALDGSFDQSCALSFEKLQIALENTKLTIYGGFYDFVKDIKSLKAKGKQVATRKEAKEGEIITSYKKCSPLIPKMLSVGIHNTSFLMVRENTSHVHDYLANIKECCVNWKLSFSLENSDFKLLSTYVNYELNELIIDTSNERFLTLEQHSFDFKLNKEIINIYTKLKSFKLTYNHCETFDWIKKNLANSSKKISTMQLKESSQPKLSTEGLEKLLGICVIKVCVELWNVSTICQLSNMQVSSINLAHAQLLMNQSDDVKSNRRITDNFLTKRSWNAELMIESLCFYLDSNVKNISGNNLKKTHVRGSVFYIGVLLSKISDYGSHKKIELTAHTFRTEYSKALSSFITEAAKSFKDYSSLRTKVALPVTETKKTSKNFFKDILNESLITNFKVTDITSFFINQHDMCSFFNLPEITISISPTKQIIEMERMQMSFVDFSNASINNLSEYSKTFISTKIVRLERSLEDNTLFIYFVHNVEASWSPNFHMHLYTLSKEIEELTTTVTRILDTKKSPPKVAKKENILKIDLYVKEQFSFTIDISSRHSMSGKIGNIYISTKKDRHISVKNVQIAIDDMKMFEITDIAISSLDELNVLTEERKNYEQFKLPINKVWAIKIGIFKGIFPYDHDFSSAIKDEFVCLYKWLKILHNFKKSPFTEKTPLPRDLIIQINEFLLEMSDDPFEVKLRDNYVLLLDEYNESLKRKKTLDHKINELRSQRLLLPAGYVEELNEKLIKKNSEIYIDRSKKMYETPARTRLFAWIMTDLKLYFMDDPSIHGYNNVTRIMQEIDEETPWPEETLEFVTLWCRAVNWSCAEWKFMLRDYPQPMFHVNSMHMFGLLCGAEQVASKRAKRDVVVEIGAPFEDFTIQRGMTCHIFLLLLY